MRRASMTGSMVVAALAGSAAPAETFHSQDGVWFEGAIRMVVSETAVCNVLEGHYREPVYERLKANHGQPLNLWRVDISVRNESGRWIDSLRAEIWVRSEHPPCSDWSGLEATPEPSMRLVWGTPSSSSSCHTGCVPVRRSAARSTCWRFTSTSRDSASGTSATTSRRRRAPAPSWVWAGHRSSGRPPRLARRWSC